MKTLLTLPSLLLATTLAAQGGLSTSSGYAVEAQAGRGDIQGVAAGTAIPNGGLRIRANDGATPAGPLASASTAVDLRPGSATNPAEVTVGESGFALPSPAARTRAGTSDDPRNGGQAAHDLRWLVPAPAGTTATVVISWNATAANGAFATALVDLDADNNPEFAQRVAGNSVQVIQRFQVTARGTPALSGFRIDISTSGQAIGAISGGSANGSRYGADLTVSLQVNQPGGCTFTNFGPECAGRLDGIAPSGGGAGQRVGLRLSNAAPLSLTILAVGDRLRTPAPLPLSRCDLLVDPAVTLGGLTDVNGTAGWSFPLPPLPNGLVLSFQAVTLQATPAGPRLGSSNGTTLVCR